MNQEPSTINHDPSTMNPRLTSVLQQYWGHRAFRPMQEEIVQSVLDGKDTLAILPTGGGKSICFQVPALFSEGLCLVVSPLIALMKDQVEHLRKKGITAYAVYSGMTWKEVKNILSVASESNCRFLYVSPERLETALFREFLPSFGITLIAVDEAHCISQWGYDFRPSYLRIAALREELPRVPILALTASATPEVQKDICEKLAFTQPAIFRKSFERPALSYSLFNVPVKITKVREILEKVAGSGIVYCRSRKRAKEISDLLNMHGIVADFYHAGLLHEERNTRQEAWIKNKIRVIVCTNAFGMGIDKPDVRLVIHADAPDCIENYYQEAGRAGRDGNNAYAVLLYSSAELSTLDELPGIHFPSLQNIRIVYQSLMNYLQVPSSSGEGNYYDFDLADFIKKFKLDSQLVIHALKALEQEELLAFNEQVFIPSKINFTTNKEALHDFEKDHPALAPLIKTLLRTYSGIFDQQVSIHERNIAFLLWKKPEEVVSELQRLHSFGVLSYVPRKDIPQVYFIQNRVKAEDLRIDQEKYQKRKKQYKRRIAAMLSYIENDRDCRSRYIANYFGDEEAKPCGVCDNCLRRKNTLLDPGEFNDIHQQIIRVVRSGRVGIKDLLLQLNSVNKDKAWKVIHYLEGENKLTADGDGILQVQ